MKIGDSTSVRSTAAPRRRAGVSGASAARFEGFLSAAEASAAGETMPMGDVAGISSLDGVLALQSVSEEETRRREVIDRGHSLLDGLESLRGALLRGTVPPDVLVTLEARLARQRAQVSDPKLLEILDDIELRVAVEQAKLERALRERGGLA